MAAHRPRLWRGRVFIRSKRRATCVCVCVCVAPGRAREVVGRLRVCVCVCLCPRRLLSSTSLRPLFMLSVSLLGLMLLERWKPKLPIITGKSPGLGGMRCCESGPRAVSLIARVKCSPVAGPLKMCYLWSTVPSVDGEVLTLCVGVCVHLFKILKYFNFITILVGCLV